MMEEAEEINHRKLIRPSLTEMKEELEQKRRKTPERDSSPGNSSLGNSPLGNSPQRNTPRRNTPQRNTSQRKTSQRNGPPRSSPQRSGPLRNAPQKGGPLRGNRPTPADHTNAESFYFVKQMQNQTPMVLVLTDGEEVCGSIEWYDRACVKIRRDDEVNLLIYKESIKYLYKANEDDEPGPEKVAVQEAAPAEAVAPEPTTDVPEVEDLDIDDPDAEDENEPNGNIAL